MIDIIKPINTVHKGDTFHKLVDLWGELGLCNVILDNVTNIWIKEEGYILLYDNPTLNILNASFQYGLFGNSIPDDPKARPWIFWGRQPKLMEDNRHNLPSYDERKINSLFLGKVENDTQRNRRTQVDWSKSVEVFEMPIFGEYKYTQLEYLQKLRDTRFGLCLPGYGYKCNREIEYLAYGVVPIITPSVNLDYYNPLIEGVHYVRANLPNEVQSKINSISKEKWIEMSCAGIEWYEQNCSPIGSFNTTIEIIEKEFGVKL